MKIKTTLKILFCGIALLLASCNSTDEVDGAGANVVTSSKNTGTSSHSGTGIPGKNIGDAESVNNDTVDADNDSETNTPNEDLE